jgi:hypothetical protein
LSKIFFEFDVYFESARAFTRCSEAARGGGVDCGNVVWAATGAERFGWPSGITNGSVGSVCLWANAA